MKTNKYKILLLAFIAMLPSFAMATGMHLYDTMTFYTWNAATSTWKIQTQNQYKYDAMHRVTSMTRISYFTLDTDVVFTTSYDAAGDEFNYAKQKFQGTWSPLVIDTFLLDNKGTPTRNIFRDANSPYSLGNGSIIYNNTYDANGNLISRLEMDYNIYTATFAHTAQRDFTLNTDGSWKSYIKKTNWNGKAWLDSILLDSIKWSNWSGNLYANVTNPLAEETSGNFYPVNSVNNSAESSLIFKAARNGKWQDSARETITYDANGGSVILIEYFTGGKWVNGIRGSNLRDSKGNNIGFKDEKYFSGNWLQIDGSNFNLTYDANDNIIQAIRQDYNSSSGGYVNSQKFVYGGFTVITAIDETSPGTQQLSLYPNPATETLKLQGKMNPSEKVNITIYNMEGQAVIATEDNGSSINSGLNLDLHALQAGMYIIRAVSGSGMLLNSKFMKN